MTDQILNISKERETLVIMTLGRMNSHEVKTFPVGTKMTVQHERIQGFVATVYIINGVRWEQL
jgi:hypothetical protein